MDEQEQEAVEKVLSAGQPEQVALDDHQSDQRCDQDGRRYDVDMDTVVRGPVGGAGAEWGEVGPVSIMPRPLERSSVLPPPSPAPDGGQCCCIASASSIARPTRATKDIRLNGSLIMRTAPSRPGIHHASV